MGVPGLRIMCQLSAALLGIGASGTASAQAPEQTPVVAIAQKPGSWKRAETEHFILFSDGTAQELRLDAIKLERFDRLMRTLTGIGDDKGQVKLSVYFVRSADKVQSLYPGPVKNIGGFYAPSPAGAVAVVPRSVDAFGSGDRKFAEVEDVVLFHEYAHHLMHQYFPVAYPAWYVEGFAEYVSNTRIDADGKASYGIANISRAPSLFLETGMPIEKLLTARVTDLKRSEISQFYARSWLLSHYLSREKTRTGQLKQYLAAIQKGTANLGAARSVFGDLDALDKALNRYMKGKLEYSQLVNPLPAPADFTVTPLDQGTSDSVLLQLKLTRMTKPEEREPIAAELRKLATRFPGNAAILTALAEAEIDLGNHAAAGRAADAAIAAAPANSRALVWKGLSLARPLAGASDRDAAKWKEARGWIVKANRANPEDPLPLMEYYLSFAQAGQAPPAIAIDGVGKAVSLVPQFSGTRLMYASALASQKKFVEAIRILERIANDPHGGSLSEFARKRIGELEAAKNGATLPEAGLKDAQP